MGSDIPPPPMMVVLPKCEVPCIEAFKSCMAKLLVPGTVSMVIPDALSFILFYCYAKLGCDTEWFFPPRVCAKILDYC